MSWKTAHFWAAWLYGLVIVDIVDYKQKDIVSGTYGGVTKLGFICVTMK